MARLGWELDERTQTRFQNAKEEKAIEALSAYHRGYELEEIGHEEDGLRVLAAMEAEGWMHSPVSCLDHGVGRCRRLWRKCASS